MNFLKRSPSSASIFCSSDDVPSVTVASAWVSPRVNSAEPWVRGRTCDLGADRADVGGLAIVDALVVVENARTRVRTR